MSPDPLPGTYDRTSNFRDLRIRAERCRRGRADCDGVGPSSRRDDTDRFFCSWILVAAMSCMILAGSGSAHGADLPDDASKPSDRRVSSTPDAPGYPNRSPEFDALPGFQNPPPGYGEVPFWWWSGEDLDVDRLLWQIRELHKKGISGVQVNYSHFDTPGWLTDTGQPGIFTEGWWKVYSRISEECGKLDMGIGLSTYTIDWPNGAHNLFYQLLYSKPELNAIELVAGKPVRVGGGETATVALIDGQFAACAYEVKAGTLQTGGIDLTSMAKDGEITWTAPEGDWEIWTFGAARRPGTLNPLMIGIGETVIRQFFQRFQDHTPDGTSAGLNYFFNDELEVGVGKFDWNGDMLQQFRQRKGYDLLDILPAMWVEMGDATPKVRIDYADVRMSLMEERYFEPIYQWHASRGIVYGCDNHGRGLEPNAYGDYFRAARWYTAPGHDTPGGHAHPIKGKVSSSIANLYQRPRVWLEGYHSLGWGAAPERLMFATRENYLYGCSLLNLHGFYYTTFGSHWEWAPPCYHFRMPYWQHMGTFLKYFERLSFLLSQGHHVCDVAVIYPVTPYEAEMNGDKARDTAFAIGRQLLAAGIDFEFIDHQSLARAQIQGGRLVIPEAQATYQALIFPSMDAVRWKSIEKAAAFAKAGGDVLAVGALPSATDRRGRNDPQLSLMNEQAFRPPCRLNATDEVIQKLGNSHVRDVRGVGTTVRALHRRVGFRDVYLVMDAKPGDVVEFRAKGRVELWDPWSGQTTPLRVRQETPTGTQVELTLQPYEAQVVVFTPGAGHENPPASARMNASTKTLSSPWRVSFEPTMDNRYGDFRLPVTPENKTIGVEARRFAWARETPDVAERAMRPSMDDRSWETKLHGYGSRFYVLGPLPNDAETEQLEAELARVVQVDPSVPIRIAGRDMHWKPYDFSWRYGKEDDPGHQGYHGLKGTITDDFLCLGKAVRGLNETRYIDEEGGSRYYLWTSATASEPLTADILISQGPPADKSHTSPVLIPAAIHVNGTRLADLDRPVELNAGSNPVLIRYDHAGRGHFVLRRASPPWTPRVKLAMRWYGDPAVIPLDAFPGEPAAEWFRFLSAPDTTAMRVHATGQIQAWIDGKPMLPSEGDRFAVPQPCPRAAVVALRVTPRVGHTGGAAIPEPIAVETGKDGTMPLGDWSKLGILNNYSGGVRYRTTFTLLEQEAKGRVELDLGRVVATAEVLVNGRKIGVRVAPPWTLDMSGAVQAGQNELEVLVYNTLANHYQTIPSRYRGDPASGLFGPVQISVDSPSSVVR